MSQMYPLFPLGGYLVGSFPTGVVLTKRKYGIDVREMGSGNIGATNVTRVFGWYAGVLVFVVDFLKGYLPLYLLVKYFPSIPWVVAATGIALVAGHCYSIYLRFRGGKGVATSLGCLFAVDPLAAIVSASVYVALLLATRISAIGSLGGVVASLLYIAIRKPSVPVRVLILGTTYLVVLRHKDNIKRLLSERKGQKK